MLNFVLAVKFFIACMFFFCLFVFIEYKRTKKCPLELRISEKKAKQKIPTSFGSATFATMHQLTLTQARPSVFV